MIVMQAAGLGSDEHQRAKAVQAAHATGQQIDDFLLGLNGANSSRGCATCVLGGQEGSLL